ncbi:hypothetical protein SD235_03685 [Burkholderia cepacia]|uniref:hypothetical protein n=1 Tax=Burkholderia cepacia TaxID=292 RepID=UPI003A4D4CB0
MSRPQQISRDCQICLGEQVEQVCSALGRALALCHATARRILDDMKRGAIDELNPASARRAASAGFSYELLGAALSARHLMSGHDFSGAFLVQTLLRVPMQVTWGNFCGSIAGVLSRTLWLPFGRSQTSFTISSTQVRPVSAFYNVGGRVGGDCSKMNESVFAMCSALDAFFQANQYCSATVSWRCDRRGTGTTSKRWFWSRSGNHGRQRAGLSFLRRCRLVLQCARR